MVEVRFINDTTPIEVEAEQQETTIGVQSESNVKNINITSNMIDKYFVFEQGIASDVWEIEHNLNKKPSVTIVDSADNIITAEVEYIDTNNIIVRMNGATTGKAYLN